MAVRFLTLLAAVAIAAAVSQSAARADLNPPITITGKFYPANTWLTCPDTGTCPASSLRLWLPSFGGGSSSVDAGTVTSSCGQGCYVIPNGALITIRAHPNPGYQFTGWGGKCGTVKSTGCYFHMWNNYTAGATFEPLPSSSGGSPDSNGSPVTTVLDFVVQVTGRGTVVVSGTGRDYPTSVCKSPAPCPLVRYQRQYVKAVAIATGGGRFLGWGGGRCSGTQTVCTFKDDFDSSNNRPRITALFG
jgi:hypothetical protein